MRIKRLSFSVLTCLFLFLLSSTALAGEARINFSDPSCTSGDTVNVSMRITSDDGTPIGKADIVLSYPGEKLDFVSGTDADGGAGSVRVHGTTNGGDTSVVEYNLVFTAKSAGTAAVTIQSYEVYDTSDNVVNITHEGSSAITISAVNDSSSDASLTLLEVYPGELEPQFSADVDTYTLSVGLGVDRLTINADPNDPSSSVTIEGNEGLSEGENSVTVRVTAADGVTSRDYTIQVLKIEGGPESIIGSGEHIGDTEGVVLSSKGRAITIMTPADDVEIPSGLREGVIKIDDQKVIGWVVDQDTEPEYCVVYGMNENGELNFYRYDLLEKSIQRYFSDPLVAGSVTGEEYNELSYELESANDKADFRLIMIAVLGVIVLIFAAISLYLYQRLGAERMRAHDNKSREIKARRSLREASPDDGSVSIDDVSAEETPAADALDETHAIKRSERRRRRRHSETLMDMGDELNIDSLDDVTDQEDKND